MYEFFNDFFFIGMTSGKVKNRDKKALIDKNWTALNTFYDLLSVVLNRFIYPELPETMDCRFLELCLITTNMAVAAKVGGDIKNYNVISTGQRSGYGYPLNISAVDFMGKNVGRFIPDTPDAVAADCVLIYDDLYNIPAISRITWYANRLTELQTSISAAIANLKGSTIIRCSKEQEKPIVAAWQRMTNGVPIILSFDEQTGVFQNPPEVITNPQTPEILISLQENYDKTLAQFCMEFGINANTIVNKMSGISTDELAQNSQLTNLRLNTEFKQRKKGLEAINKMWGTNARVELNFDVVNAEPKTKELENEEGKGDNNNDI